MAGPHVQVYNPLEAMLDDNGEPCGVDDYRKPDVQTQKELQQLQKAGEKIVSSWKHRMNEVNQPKIESRKGNSTSGQII